MLCHKQPCDTGRAHLEGNSAQGSSKSIRQMGPMSGLGAQGLLVTMRWEGHFQRFCRQPLCGPSTRIVILLSPDTHTHMHMHAHTHYLTFQMFRGSFSPPVGKAQTHQVKNVCSTNLTGSWLPFCLPPFVSTSSSTQPSLISLILDYKTSQT